MLEVSPDGIRFPSLIGRLKTDLGLTQMVMVLGFPSLIGRLKTLIANKRVGAFGLFPSLIGRLKTNILTKLDQIDSRRFHPS